MRKIASIIIIALFFTCCKRKNIEISPPATLAENPEHCYNGLLDSDELGIDCGGSCKSCSYPVPTCSLLPNSLQFNGQTYTITNQNCGNLADNNYYDFRGSYPGGTFIVRIPGSLPDLGKTYSIKTASYPGVDEAFVSLSSSAYGNMTSVIGSVYIGQIGGKYKVSVCGASFFSFVTNQEYPVNLQSTCN